MRLDYGDIVAQQVSERIHATVATLAALKSTPPKGRVHGQIVHVQADGSIWRFHSSSVLTGDDQLVCAPTVPGGAWLRMPGACRLKLPIGFATADAAVLLTMQAGQILRLIEPAWHITTSFTGGTNSAIGLSSNKTSYSTKGDLLGGAGGDIAAALTSALGVNAIGTVGAGFDSLAKRRMVLMAGNTVRFDRIVDAFLAGAGFAVLDGILASNDGA